MRELSLNILDVARNSIEAGCSNLRIKIVESKSRMKVSISDDGRGMSAAEKIKAIDPFYSSKKSAKVGLGLPLLKMAAERTGGRMKIYSLAGKGTLIKAIFYTDSIDFIPLGDIASTVMCILSANPDIRIRFSHRIENHVIRLDSKGLEKICGASQFGQYEYAKIYLESKYQERI